MQMTYVNNVRQLSETIIDLYQYVRIQQMLHNLHKCKKTVVNWHIKGRGYNT